MAEYIEREALKEHLMSYAGMFTDELGFVVSLQAVLNGIDFQPAADVAEVVHGRWESNSVLVGCMKWEHYYACTACGRRGTSHKTNYCPNCGARMDGEWSEV